MVVQEIHGADDGNILEGYTAVKEKAVDDIGRGPSKNPDLE